jgi:hypothetical protein
MTIGCALAVRLLQAVCLMCSSTSLVANAKDIRSIIVAADLTQYSGRCPVIVHFKAKVRLTRTPMTVHYFWEHSGGEMSRTDTVSLPRGMDPEFEVRDSWAVGASEGRFTITDRLHGSTENDSAMSETAQFTVHCTP